jgi:hypothetical protein
MAVAPLQSLSDGYQYAARMPLDRATQSKVPETTARSWITRLLTAAMGESTSDYLVRRIDPVEEVLAGAY